MLQIVRASNADDTTFVLDSQVAKGKELGHTMLGPG